VHERYEGIRKDGSSLCLEYTGAGTRYHGKPAAVGLFLDMAAQKKVADALRGSEERFRAIFDRVNDVIFFVELTPDNRPGRLIEVNRAACTSLHYQRGKLLNMPVGKVEEPGGGTVLAEIMERLLLYGTAKYEAVELRTDGTPLPVEVNSHLCEIDGRSAILAVARDIAARKERQSMEAEAFSRSRRTWSSSPSSTTTLNTPFRCSWGLQTCTTRRSLKRSASKPEISMPSSAALTRAGSGPKRSGGCFAGTTACSRTMLGSTEQVRRSGDPGSSLSLACSPKPSSRYDDDPAITRRGDA